MGAQTLTCSGAVTIDTSFRPVCVDGWTLEPVETGYLTNQDFYDLWGPLVGLLVAGYIVKRLLATLV